MDDTSKLLLQRLVRRIPTQMLKATLDKWGRLTVEQRQAMDFTQSKWALTQKLLSVCEENKLTLTHLAELEMIHAMENPNQGMWYTFQLLEPENDAQSVELTQFKQQFKCHLSELLRQMSVKIKKHTDEAVWIRIALGSSFSKPNHLKPTYVVHYLQTPYVFVRNLTSKLKPLLSQALTLATRHQGVKEANLSGRNLTSIRDLLMRQYQQVFPTKYRSPPEEEDQPVLNQHIEKEQGGVAAHRRHMAHQAFGDGMLPQLQSAVYMLDTKFRDPNNRTMTEREETFKCVVKFSSIDLLESLRSCASSGIASAPVTPLLSSIPLKGRNYFVVTDNTPGPSSQGHQTQN
ncbi:centromere protein N [Oryzias latipes]|uniref:Centromere protein N n=1 Tax=Oryzias latipes TaxID=8090 RepID=H2M0T1_ORYLA|nr:centromere protein N [Oryzias latipes]